MEGQSTAALRREGVRVVGRRFSRVHEGLPTFSHTECRQVLPASVGPDVTSLYRGTVRGPGGNTSARCQVEGGSAAVAHQAVCGCEQ
jgi:hypothetical protein